MEALPVTSRPEDSVIGVYQRHGATWAGLRGERLSEGSWLDRVCALIPFGGPGLDLRCGAGGRPPPRGEPAGLRRDGNRCDADDARAVSTQPAGYAGSPC